MSSIKNAWIALGTSLFVLLSLGYTYLVIAAPERSLPLIHTQGSIAANEQQRWIFVGDIHGMFKEFTELMAEVKAEDDNTHVVLLGDFTSKGPQSRAVVDYIREHQNTTHCILGNHEVNVMFAYLNPAGLEHGLSNGRTHWKPLDFSSESYIPPRGQVNLMHKRVVRELGEERVEWIAAHCPAELTIEFGPQTLIAVHAGLDPDLSPGDVPRVKDITTMKYMLPKDHSKTSKFKFKHSRRWYKLWDKQHAPKDTTVLYGHDSSNGLTLRKRTKGLDSSCVSGGQLSALEVVYRDGKYQEFLHQVECQKMI
ncbi:LAQU0S05e05314g1_1 [Lachancea quebecensis]|uniref:LAQU0S05e05314g1_1 n=1 Tax=Lachancea quebecensis TaxID=1654605 RepID=A0A0P1KTS2_9SACH|nr:LAQU0S05e05314g1_1 [Lachancea quebecensis]